MTKRTLEDALASVEEARIALSQSPEAVHRVVRASLGSNPGRVFMDTILLADEVKRLQAENKELQDLNDSMPYTY